MILIAIGIIAFIAAFISQKAELSKPEPEQFEDEEEEETNEPANDEKEESGTVEPGATKPE